MLRPVLCFILLMSASPAAAEMLRGPGFILGHVPFFGHGLWTATGVPFDYIGAVSQDQQDGVICAVPSFPYGAILASCPDHPPGLICGFSITRFRATLTNLGAADDALTLRGLHEPEETVATASGAGGAASIEFVRGDDCPLILVLGTQVSLVKAPYTLRLEYLPLAAGAEQ